MPEGQSGSYTNLQSFLEQLSAMGIYGEEAAGPLATDYYGLGSIQTSDLASKFADYFGLGEATQGLGGMVSGLPEGLLKGASITNWSDLIQSGQSNLLNQLTGARTSKVGKRAYGGFAGSGAVDVYGKQIAGEYGKGITDVLSNVYGQRGQAQAGLGSWLQQNIENVLSLKS